MLIFVLVGCLLNVHIIMPFLSAAKLQSTTMEWWINKADQMDLECMCAIYDHSQPASIICHLRACHLGDVMSFTPSFSASIASNQPIEHREFLQIVYKVPNDYHHRFVVNVTIFQTLYGMYKSPSSVSKCSCINMDVFFFLEKIVS